MATQNYGERRIDIPPLPTDQTSSTSSYVDAFCLRFSVSFLFSLNVIHIVASLVVLWVSIAHGHPDNKITAWLVGNASGCAVMLSFLCFHYRNAGTLNPRQRNVMLVFWLIMSCFFLVWFFFGLECFSEAASSSGHDASALKRVLIGLLWGLCGLYGTPVLVLASMCLFLPCFIWAILVSPKEKPRETSYPDSPNGGRSGDEGGLLLAAATKEDHTLSGEDMVCSICLRKFADTDELRELPCCGHFFHVECVDKWLKINTRNPPCKSELGWADGAAT